MTCFSVANFLDLPCFADSVPMTALNCEHLLLTHWSGSPRSDPKLTAPCSARPYFVTAQGRAELGQVPPADRQPVFLAPAGYTAPSQSPHPCRLSACRAPPQGLAPHYRPTQTPSLAVKYDCILETLRPLRRRMPLREHCWSLPSRGHHVQAGVSQGDGGASLAV